MIGENIVDRLGLRGRSSLWRDGARVTQDILPMELPQGQILVGLRREATRRAGRVVGYVVFASDATKDVLAEHEGDELSDELTPVVERLAGVLHEVVPFDVLGLYAVEDGAYHELVTVTAAENGPLTAYQDLRALRTAIPPGVLQRLAGLSVLTFQEVVGDDELAWFIRDVSGARAAILVGLRRETSVHSLLLVGFHRPGVIQDEHVGLVEAVAPLLSRAVRRMLVVEHEREAKRRLGEIDALRQRLVHMVDNQQVRLADGSLGDASAELERLLQQSP
jgi:hypothetical protein